MFIWSASAAVYFSTKSTTESITVLWLGDHMSAYGTYFIYRDGQEVHSGNGMDLKSDGSIIIPSLNPGQQYMIRVEVINLDGAMYDLTNMAKATGMFETFYKSSAISTSRLCERLASVCVKERQM